MGKLIWQFAKFCFVGFSNTFISYSIYYILKYLGVHFLAAFSIGFGISVLNAYYWSNKYVFERTHEKLGKNLMKMYLSYGLTFLLSNLLLALFVNLLKISENIAPIILLLITIPLNFVLNKFWVFSKRIS